MGCGALKNLIGDLFGIPKGYTQNQFGLINTQVNKATSPIIKDIGSLLTKGFTYKDSYSVVSILKSKNYRGAKSFIKDIEKGDYFHGFPSVYLYGPRSIVSEAIPAAIINKFRVSPTSYGIDDVFDNFSTYYRYKVLEHIFNTISAQIGWSRHPRDDTKLVLNGDNYTIITDFSISIEYAPSDLSISLIKDTDSTIVIDYPEIFNFPEGFNADTANDYFIATISVTPYYYALSRYEVEQTEKEMAVFDSDSSTDSGESTNTYKIIPGISLRTYSVNIKDEEDDEIRTSKEKQLERFNIDAEAVLNNYKASMDEGDFDEYLDHLTLEFKANAASEIPINKKYHFLNFNTVGLIRINTNISSYYRPLRYKISWDYENFEGNFGFYELDKDTYNYQDVLDNPDSDYSKAYYSNKSKLKDGKVTKTFYQSSCHIPMDTDVYVANNTREVKVWLKLPTTTYISISKNSMQIYNKDVDIDNITLYAGNTYEKDSNGNLVIYFNKFAGTFEYKIKNTDPDINPRFRNIPIRTISDNIIYYEVQPDRVNVVRITGLIGNAVSTDTDTKVSQTISLTLYDSENFIGIPISSRVFKRFPGKSKYLLIDSNMYYTGYIAYSRWIKYTSTERFTQALGFVLQVIAFVILVYSLGSAKSLSTFLYALGKQLLTQILIQEVIKILSKYLSPELTAIIAIYLTLKFGGTDASALTTAGQVLNSITYTYNVYINQDMLELDKLQREEDIKQEAMGQELEDLYNTIGLDRYGRELDSTYYYTRIGVNYARPQDVTNMTAYLKRSMYKYRIYGTKGSSNSYNRFKLT